MLIRFIFFQFFFKLTVTLCIVTDMVRTRGAGSQLEGQARPTTSMRRRDQGASSSALLLVVMLLLLVVKLLVLVVVMLVRW